MRFQVLDLSKRLWKNRAFNERIMYLKEENGDIHPEG